MIESTAIPRLLDQPPSPRKVFGRAPEFAQLIFREQMPIWRYGSKPAALVPGLERKPALREHRRERDADAAVDAPLGPAPVSGEDWCPRGQTTPVGAAPFAPRGNDIPGSPRVLVIITKVSMRSHAISLGTHRACDSAHHTSPA